MSQTLLHGNVHSERCMDRLFEFEVVMAEWATYFTCVEWLKLCKTIRLHTRCGACWAGRYAANC